MTRIFGRRLTQLAATVTLVAATASSVVAEEINVDTWFGWLGVGTTYVPREGHYYWIGEFSGTLSDNGAGSILNNAAAQCPAWDDIDTTTGVEVGGGYCVITLSSGDQIHVRWTLAGDANRQDLGAAGVSEIIGGTGAMAGVTGEWLWQGFTLVSHPDGKLSGYADGTMRLVLP